MDCGFPQSSFVKGNVMNNICLKDLLNSYTDNLCDKSFILTLEGNQKIEIRFFRESMCHLMGLQHVFGNDRRFLGARGYKKIADEALTIKSFKMHNKNKYNFIKDRIEHFDEIIDVMQYGNLVRFVREKVKRNTYIEADFILYKDEQKYLLHLFLVKEYGTDIYTPRSYVVLSDKDDKTIFISSNRPIKIIDREEIVIKN